MNIKKDDLNFGKLLSIIRQVHE